MMGLLRRRKPSVTRDQALAARPRRLVEAAMQLREDDRGGALRVPLAPPRWGAWLFRVPQGATKTYEFDAIGVFVWNLCDGKNTVQHMIRKLAKEYNLNLREAEIATIQFLQMLARKGLIGLKIQDERQNARKP